MGVRLFHVAGVLLAAADVLPVTGLPTGDGGFLLPLPFCQGAGRCSFNEIDSLGGAPGDGCCGISKVWSPLAARELDKDRRGVGSELEFGDEEDELES